MKVLIVKTSSMGDIIHALPLVHDLTAAHPDAEIHWLAEESFRDIPTFAPAVSSVHRTAFRRWRRTPFAASVREEIGALKSALREADYDAVLDIQGLLRSAVAARWTGKPVTGYTRRTVREPLASWFYDKTLDLPESLGAVRRYRLAAAEAFGYPVALKVESYVIQHKTDVGGVRLGLQDRAAVKEAFLQMDSAMKRLDPSACVTVQPMAQSGFEVMLGAARLHDTPLMAAGMGGIYAEAFQDMAFRLAPLQEGQAERMLQSLRCAPVLNGFRTPPLDRAGVCQLLQRLSDLMQAFAQIREVDLNPCRVYENGCAILDARIVLQL